MPALAASPGGLTLMLLALGLYCLRGGAKRAQPERAQDAGASEEEGFAFRRVRLTQYWAASLAPDDDGEDLLDVRGRFLARVSPKSKRRLVTEGAGRLPDGRVLNVTGVQDRFLVVTQGGRGVGVEGRSLRPFLSVATDRKGKSPLVKVGTRLYVRELDGHRLPDGMVHDGWVWADDRRDGLVGAHLALFVGEPRAALTLPSMVSVWLPELPAASTQPGRAS